MTLARRQLPARSPLTWRDVAAALGRGDEREALRLALIAEFGASDAVLTDSGTSALALALALAVRHRPGTYCALPAYGCFDLATAALAAGTPVVLYDVDPRTLAPLEASLSEVIVDGCGAVVIVDHFGIPADFAPIVARARRAGALVIEDAAQAAGATRAGRRIGDGVDAAVLSFGRGKGVTGGGGGALLTFGTLDAAAAASRGGALGSPEPQGLAFLVKLAAQWALARPAVYGIPARLPFLRLGETVFREPHEPAGIGVRSARVIRRTLASMDAEAAIRRRNAARLREAQGRWAPSSLVEVPGGGEPGWLRLPVLLGARRREVLQRGVSLGVMPGYPISLDRLAPLRPALRRVTGVSGAASLSESLCTLPTHGALDEGDLQRLEAWIRDLEDGT